MKKKEILFFKYFKSFDCKIGVSMKRVRRKKKVEKKYETSCTGSVATHCKSHLHKESINHTLGNTYVHELAALLQLDEFYVRVAAEWIEQRSVCLTA